MSYTDFSRKYTNFSSSAKTQNETKNWTNLFHAETRNFTLARLPKFMSARSFTTDDEMYRQNGDIFDKIQRNGKVHLANIEVKIKVRLKEMWQEGSLQI